MKIRLPAKELNHALTGLSKVVSRRSTLPILQAVRIDADGTGVRIAGTDLDSHLTFRFPAAESLKPGTVVADMSRLKGLLARAAKDEAAIETAGEQAATVTLDGPLGTREHALSTYEPEEWPVMPRPVPTQPVDPSFLETYRRLLPFTSRDQTRAVLCGVCIERGESGHTMIATDGRRLTSVNSLALPLEDSCIVPTHKLLAWPRLGPDCRIGADGEQFSLVSGPWCFQTRLIQGHFPNWRQVTPPPGDNGFEVPDEDLPVLEEALRTLPGNTTDSRMVVFTGNGEGLRVAGLDPDTERWSFCSLPGTRTKGTVGIAVNRDYFHDALRAGFRSFHCSDELSPLTATDGNGSVHVVMPLRTEMPTNVKQSKPPATPPAPAPRESPAKKPEKSPAAPANHPESTRRRQMSETPQKTDELAAFAELQAAAGEVKTKLQEARAAVARVTTAAKAAMKEARQQRAEVEAARATLAKLKAIDL